MTVTGEALTEAATILVFNEDEDAIFEGRITPEAPSLSVPLPTGSKGVFEYDVEAEFEAEDSWGTYGYARFELTVSGVPTAVTASFTTPAKVKAGSSAGTITGSTSHGGLPLEVQSRMAGGEWVPIASASSGADGAYSMPIPTFWVGRQQLRVSTVSTATHDVSVAATLGAVTVRRPQKLLGTTKHSVAFPSIPRWNPCRVIEYRLNPSRMPKWGPAATSRALRAISQETGLRFRYVGATDHVPYHRKQGPMAFVDDADLVIAWATPKDVPALRGTTIGLGRAQHSSGSGELHSGGVVIDALQEPRNGRTGQRELMMHELGHAVGLGHVNDTKQVMNGHLSRNGLKWWGRGDVAGLERLGARGGCLASPTEQDRVSARKHPTEYFVLT